MPSSPARYKKMRRLKKRGNYIGKNKLILKNIKRFAVFALIAVILFLSLFIIFKKNYWTGEDKLPVAVREKSGDISLIVFDPVAEEITTILIPKNTQVEVWGNLGVWKLSSVWQLGIQEGIGGKLLAKTLTYYMKFPVYSWADSGFSQIAGNNPLGIVSAVFASGRSNLSLKDKVSMALFSLKVKNANRQFINLSGTNFLKALKLPDGEEGYVMTNINSPRLYSIFNDYDFLGNSLKILIKDGSGNYGTAQNVGKILEIMGSRVSSISSIEGEEELSCLVHSNNRKVAEKMSKIFDCRIEDRVVDGNYDLEIILGSQFSLN